MPPHSQPFGYHIFAPLSYGYLLTTLLFPHVVLSCIHPLCTLLPIRSNSSPTPHFPPQECRVCVSEEDEVPSTVTRLTTTITPLECLLPTRAPIAPAVPLPPVEESLLAVMLLVVVLLGEGHQVPLVVLVREGLLTLVKDFKIATVLPTISSVMPAVALAIALALVPVVESHRHLGVVGVGTLQDTTPTMLRIIIIQTDGH